MLGISYKAAWFMCHRVREGATILPQLRGIVEAERPTTGYPDHADTLYSTNAGSRDRAGSTAGALSLSRPIQNKTTIRGMVERGGAVVSQVIPKTTVEHVKPIMTRKLSIKDGSGHG